MRRQSGCIKVMTGLLHSNRHTAGQDKQQDLDHYEVEDSNMEREENVYYSIYLKGHVYFDCLALVKYKETG